MNGEKGWTVPVLRNAVPRPHAVFWNRPKAQPYRESPFVATSEITDPWNPKPWDERTRSPCQRQVTKLSDTDSNVPITGICLDHEGEQLRWSSFNREILEKHNTQHFARRGHKCHLVNLIHAQKFPTARYFGKFVLNHMTTEMPPLPQQNTAKPNPWLPPGQRVILWISFIDFNIFCGYA